MIRRETIASRMARTLSVIKAQLHRRRHQPIGLQGRWLGSVVRGWMAYYAVPGNVSRLRRFRDEVSRLWLRALRRRSQRHRWPWSSNETAAPDLLASRPRSATRIQTNDFAPESRQEPYETTLKYGSVRGAVGNGRPYRDRSNSRVYPPHRLA